MSKQNAKAAMESMSEASMLLASSQVSLARILSHQTELNEDQRSCIASANSSVIDYLTNANRELEGLNG